MRVTNWEFSHRALVFGLIYFVGFQLYALDHPTSTVVLARGLSAHLRVDPNLAARLLFGCAALLLAAAAFLRTWASSYLHASVVYAADVKSASLVADGPYRHVRNPLYLANVLMAIGMGATMSRSGSLSPSPR